MLHVWLLDLQTEQLTNAGSASSAYAPLHLDWAPLRDVLAYQGHGTVAVVDASGISLARGAVPGLELPILVLPHLVWQPDSRGLILRLDHGALFCMDVRGGELAEVRTRRWQCENAAFLPCSRHERFWVALALCRQGHRRRTYIGLQPRDGLGGSHGVADVPAGGSCLHLAASAQRVVACLTALHETAGPASVHVYGVEAVGLALVLRPEHVIQAHACSCTCALSPCGLLVAYTALPAPPGQRTHWFAEERRDMGSLLSIACMQSPSWRSHTPAQPRFGEFHLSIVWSSDSRRLAVTGATYNTARRQRTYELR